MKRQSIAEARTNLPKLIREAEKGKAVELTRRGESVAVLIGKREYERLVARKEKKGFSAALDEFLNDPRWRDIDVDVDGFLEGIRDKSPGRDTNPWD